ncbi:hypothetical protein [Pimelobacter simplex]|uniref:hypothetical protein n=1 Tax=Nocardioides simplex TaxID=2045 RepID=UPI003AABEB22
MRSVVRLLIGVLLLTGCSTGPDAPAPGPGPRASQSPGPLAIPTPSSTITVQPAAQPWTTAESVRRYRAAMRPVNRRLDGLAALSPAAPLDEARAALRAFARSSAQAATALSRGAWSAATSDRVTTLVAALLDQADFLDGLADEPDLTAIRAEADRTGRTLLVTRTCAAALEKVLGIGDGLLDLAPAGTATP